MEVKVKYRFHEFGKIIPNELPKNIITIDQIKDKYNFNRTQEFPANSLVAQAVPLLFGCFGVYNSTIASVKDTGNTGRTIMVGDAYQFGHTSALAGIQLGTGDTAVTLNDYKLETAISDGTGAGQLVYGLSQPVIAFPTLTSGSSNSFSLCRIFTNSRTSDLVVKEAGLTCSHSSYVFLMERTVLSPTYNFVAKTCVMAEYISVVTV